MKKTEDEVRAQQKSDSFFTEYDQYLFGNGRDYKIYEKMGAHPRVVNRKKGMEFVVWAPHAKSVSVVGDFNDWDPHVNPLRKRGSVRRASVVSRPA